MFYGLEHPELSLFCAPGLQSARRRRSGEGAAAAKASCSLILILLAGEDAREVYLEVRFVLDRFGSLVMGHWGAQLSVKWGY